MKNIKKLWIGSMAVIMLATSVTLSGCGGSSNYTGYSNAYKKLASGGSMDADFTIDLKTDEDTMNATGNMKLDVNAEKMYFEMTVGDTTIKEYLSDGQLYTDVDGQKVSFDTEAQEQQGEDRPAPENGEAEQAKDVKEEAESFELESFLEEMAAMIEATKIKEMGLLDPIPEKVINEITVTNDGDGKTYNLVLSDALVTKLFNTMISEQTSDEDYALSFDDIKNFKCIMHENSDGAIDQMVYGGITKVTVPSALTGSEDEDFDLDITITVDLNNPGSAVTVPEYDVSGY